MDATLIGCLHPLILVPHPHLCTCSIVSNAWVSLFIDRKEARKTGAGSFIQAASLDVMKRLG